MLDLIDLPMIWASIIALAVFLYVLLDGFTLGVGILFPFGRSDRARDLMMSSVAPNWDGNETWLVMGAGGLFAAFPLAYSILLPAFYMPIGFMLTALILRGVAFEFRSKAGPVSRKVWDQAFHLGSVAAAFSQGIILGSFVQGVEVKNNAFAGGAFDWFTPFSFVTGWALVWGYALLGATWLIIKTERQHQAWARTAAQIVTIGVLGFMVLVSVWVLFLDTSIPERWGLAYPNFDFGRLAKHSAVPIFVVYFAYKLIISVRNGATYCPFFSAVALFALGYLGLGISIFPAMVPYDLSVWDAAAAPSSQKFLLIGTVFLLPIILAYTAYAYWVFRGKVKVDEGYH